jgi:hypothetical protein
MEKSAVDPNEMQSLVEKFESNCRMSNPHRATNPVSEREAEPSVQVGWIWLQRALRSKMDATNQLRLLHVTPMQMTRNVTQPDIATLFANRNLVARMTG